jgi:hypothetical protein
MADTTSGPEGPQDEASSGDETSSADGASSGGGARSQEEASSQEEVKRKFREALDRKRAKEMEAGGRRRGKDTGKVHGVHGPARNRRSFRRKSGG